MQKLTLLVMASFLMACAVGDELTEFKFEEPRVADQKASPAVCQIEKIEMLDDLVVYAAGGYAGRALDFQIDQSGHTATQFDIAVNSPHEPVALILGAYEPTIWNIGWTHRTRIVAVFASGYHRQLVAGLPSDVPVLISTYDNRGPCGHFYVGKGRNTALNPRSRNLFGQPVTLVYPGDRSGKIIVGDTFTPGTPMVTSAENSPESYRDDSAPLAGLGGLEDAVERGIIRPATTADADAWVEAQMAMSPDVDVPPVAGQGVPKPPRPRMYRAYVVLKPFTYPSGLNGANSATFFIAEGVPRPVGNPGHSSVYDFNSLKCHGTGCSR